MWKKPSWRAAAPENLEILPQLDVSPWPGVEWETMDFIEENTCFPQGKQLFPSRKNPNHIMHMCLEAGLGGPAPREAPRAPRRPARPSD